MAITLTQQQNALVDQLQQLAISSKSHFPSTLIYGSPGIGKRTVVSELAENLGLELIEINASDSADFVGARLFGVSSDNALQAFNRTSFGMQGELTRTREAIIYLSAFDQLSTDQAFRQAIYRVLAKRSFVDPTGEIHRLGDDLWIIASMSECHDSASQSSISLNNWLCTHFEHQLRLEGPNTIEELSTLVEGLLQEYGCSAQRSVDTSLLEMVLDAPDCLRSLRRWVACAARKRTKDGKLSMDNLANAVISDAASICVRLRYCGQTLDVSRFERWAAQFGDFQSVAIHLLRWIGREYFISDREYFKAIDVLIERSKIPSGNRVVFCKWQSEGQSGPRVANQIKNRANWRVEAGYEIDLTRSEEEWPHLDANATHRLVLVDDFVGSGQTISRLFAGNKAPIPRLLSRLPNAHLWIGIIVGFDQALRDSLCTIDEYRERVTISPYKLLTEKDKCFSDTSRIFVNPSTRDRFKEFCLRKAKEHYPGLSNNLRLGFNDTASLIVFHDTVPNNSIPIIWHNKGTWIPLFPASGLPDKT